MYKLSAEPFKVDLEKCKLLAHSVHIIMHANVNMHIHHADIMCACFTTNTSWCSRSHKVTNYWLKN